MLTSKQQRRSKRPTADLAVPELEQSKISVHTTLPSAHSRRTYLLALAARSTSLSSMKIFWPF